MSNTIVGYLPLEPAHLRFVEWRENLDHGQALHLPGRSPIASHLTGMMSLSILFADEDRFPQPAPLHLQAFTAKLHFEAHHHLGRSEIFYLADRVAFYFNDYIYNLLHEDLMNLVLQGKKEGKQERHVIERFLRHTQLDEYLDFESVKKAQYRTRTYRRLPSIKGHRLMQAAL